MLKQNSATVAPYSWHHHAFRSKNWGILFIPKDPNVFETTLRTNLQWERTRRISWTILFMIRTLIIVIESSSRKPKKWFKIARNSTSHLEIQNMKLFLQSLESSKNKIRLSPHICCEFLFLMKFFHGILKVLTILLSGVVLKR